MTHRGTASTTAVLLLTLMIASCTPMGEGVLRKDSEEKTRESAGALRTDTLEITPSDLPALDEATRSTIKTHGPLIRAYASRYGFDWRLILAVMRQESRFSSTAVSHKGAYGLMQISPVTGEEVAGVLGLEDVTRPQNNIKGGIFYLRQMYDLLGAPDETERLRLSLAAYNAGVGRIYDAQRLAAYLHEDPTSWQSIKDALPLLSKRYYTLHKNVWADAKPTSGWFGDAGETVAYVDAIMEYYDDYRLLLN
jgi:membrane-bound lytic murein transglycosylase F